LRREKTASHRRGNTLLQARATCGTDLNETSTII
jgi:hypothetical protein